MHAIRFRNVANPNTIEAVQQRLVSATPRCISIAATLSSIKWRQAYHRRMRRRAAPAPKSQSFLPRMIRVPFPYFLKTFKRDQTDAPQMMTDPTAKFCEEVNDALKNDQLDELNEETLEELLEFASNLQVPHDLGGCDPINMSILLGEVRKKTIASVGLDSKIVDQYIHPDLKRSAQFASKGVAHFGQAIEAALIKYNRKIFEEVAVGEAGNQFKITMKTLKTGRFGMAATLSGAMRSLTKKAVDFATQQTRFGQGIDSAIQRKIIHMASIKYVNDSITHIMNSNMVPEELKTVISEVLASECFWDLAGDTVEVLVGLSLLRLLLVLSRKSITKADIKELQLTFKNPTANWGHLLVEVRKRANALVAPDSRQNMDQRFHPELKGCVKSASKSLTLLSRAIEDALIKFNVKILKEQFVLKSIASVSFELFTMVVMLSHCSESLKKNSPTASQEKIIAELWCKAASARIEKTLNELSSSVR